MKFIVQGLIGLALFAALLIGVLDYMGGCGESWVQADGTRLMGECIGREMLLHLFLNLLFN